MSSGGPVGGGYADRRTAAVGTESTRVPAAATTTDVPQDPRAGSTARTTATRSALQGEGRSDRVSTSVDPGCAGTEHGTLNAHRFHRCRCPEARRAHNRYRTQLRLDHLHGVRRSLTATGTHRRLQALTAIGWTDAAIAAELGVTRGALYQLRRRAKVHRGTADRVAAVYDRLWRTPGGSAAAARRAMAAGWLPPLWWDDDRIDDPAYDPRADVLTHPEDELAPSRARRQYRLPEVARLTDSGLSAAQIAARLGVSARQVVRDRSDLPLLPAAHADRTSLETRTIA